MVAQLLAAAPLASALPAADHDGSMPCAGHMDMAAMQADKDNCPCCPDAATSLRDCLAACTLAVAALPTTQVLPRAPEPATRVDEAPAAPLVSLSDPPLKPPPIR